MSQAAYSREAYADAELVAQLRAGDEAAVSRLVNQWSPTMLRVARSFVDSPQSAEDVVQDAWLGMLGGLAKFEGRSSLSSIGVTSRCDTAPERVVLSREVLLELDRALSALPSRQRQVVTMRDVFGMSTAEVCAALGVLPPVARTRDGWSMRPWRPARSRLLAALFHPNPARWPRCRERSTVLGTLTECHAGAPRAGQQPRARNPDIVQDTSDPRGVVPGQRLGEHST